MWDVRKLDEEQGMREGARNSTGVPKIQKKNTISAAKFYVRRRNGGKEKMTNLRDKKIKYKLVDGYGYTRSGDTGETYWLDGCEKTATGEGSEFCSPDVIHYYDHPLLAVLFNPIHANIKKPRLIEILIDKQWAHDGLKGGCKKATYQKEIVPPKISTEQKVTFAIKIALKYHKNKEYRAWAVNWLNGKDRSATSAALVAWSGALTAWSRASGAELGARAGAAAAWSGARAEASVEESVASTAELASRSAASSGATAAKISNLFLKTIERIINQKEEKKNGH